MAPKLCLIPRSARQGASRHSRRRLTAAPHGKGTHGCCSETPWRVRLRCGSMGTGVRRCEENRDRRARMTERRKLIAGNWKMNGLKGDGLALARALKERAARETLLCDLLLCPPATLLVPLAELLAGSALGLGGQDCDAKPKGAHTG